MGFLVTLIQPRFSSFIHRWSKVGRNGRQRGTNRRYSIVFSYRFYCFPSMRHRFPSYFILVIIIALREWIWFESGWRREKENIDWKRKTVESIEPYSSWTDTLDNLTFKYRGWKKRGRVWMIRVNVSGIQYHFVVIIADFNYYHRIFGTKERWNKGKIIRL